MPELPEVETVRRGLNKLLIGKTVEHVDYNWPKGFPNAESDVKAYLIGAKIVAVRRRAKVLVIDLNTKYSLVIHLKMTGQLVFRGHTTCTTHLASQAKLAFPGGLSAPHGVASSGTPSAVLKYDSVRSSPAPSGASECEMCQDMNFGAGHPTDSLIGKLPDRSTRVVFDMKDGSKLFFNDQRKFGWVRLLPTVEVGQLDFFKKVGPEPLSDDFKPAEFISRIRRRQRSVIKAALLDQTVVAGVGNIYADETLFDAKIHPETRVQNVTDAKLTKLYHAIREILQLAIDKGGSTDRNYVDAEGKKGSYLTFAKVFRREGQPCQRCGTTIIKTRVAGRGTHICPHCQKLVV